MALASGPLAFVQRGNSVFGRASALRPSEPLASTVRDPVSCHPDSWRRRALRTTELGLFERSAGGVDRAKLRLAHSESAASFHLRRRTVGRARGKAGKKASTKSLGDKRLPLKFSQTHSSFRALVVEGSIHLFRRWRYGVRNFCGIVVL